MNERINELTYTCMWVGRSVGMRRRAGLLIDFLFYLRTYLFYLFIYVYLLN